MFYLQKISDVYATMLKNGYKSKFDCDVVKERYNLKLLELSFKTKSALMKDYVDTNNCIERLKKIVPFSLKKEAYNEWTIDRLQKLKKEIIKHIRFIVKNERK